MLTLLTMLYDFIQGPHHRLLTQLAGTIERVDAAVRRARRAKRDAQYASALRECNQGGFSNEDFIYQRHVDVEQADAKEQDSKETLMICIADAQDLLRRIQRTYLGKWKSWQVESLLDNVVNLVRLLQKALDLVVGYRASELIGSRVESIETYEAAMAFVNALPVDLQPAKTIADWDALVQLILRR